MKKIALAITLISTLLIGSELNTVDTYKEALDIAKDANKTVLFMTSIEGCPVCDYMKDVVFEKEKVINYLNQNYVMVIRDAETQSYPKQFHTRDMPTFYFINPKDEKEIRKPKVGGSTPKKFLSVIKKVIESENNNTVALAPKIHTKEGIH
jgi:thioredoxin-related protein